MKTALILWRRNGVGLDRDASLLGEQLAALGVHVKFPRPWRIGDALSQEFEADAAFHLERVAPAFWGRKARFHFLIPNQERFPLRLRGRLPGMDGIWCKSQHAKEVFGNLRPDAVHVGFTSKDRLLCGATPDYSRFFHLAGRSTMKNTGLLLELWRRHPEWPRLTILQHPENAPKQVPANVNLIDRYIDDAELQELQNACGIHLCPSLSEGWGHYIMEAMSCRAVVVTTDAPPMNELVDAGTGFLVPFSRSEPRHLGTNFYAIPERLTEVIQTLLVMPEEEKRTQGIAARKQFETNHASFKTRLRAEVGRFSSS